MSAKCSICAKTAYAQESVTVDGNTWHKNCFKCATCALRLDLQTYRFGFGENSSVAYCKKCVPLIKATDTADRLDISSALARPKVGLVNDQVRGELAGQKPCENIDSMAISGRIHAPKQGIINEQIRGELAGQKPCENIDSMAISSRMHAPRRSVVNEQIRGELAGQKPHEDINSMAISSRIHAPRRSVVNEQIRGELAGQKSLEDTTSIGMSARINAPRIATVNNQIRGGNRKMRLSDVISVHVTCDEPEKVLESSIVEVRAYLATLESKEFGIRKAQQRRTMIRTASEEDRLSSHTATADDTRVKPISVIAPEESCADPQPMTPRESVTEAIAEVCEAPEVPAADEVPLSPSALKSINPADVEPSERRDSILLQRMQLELVVQRHLATMYLKELERVRDAQASDHNELARLREEIQTHDMLDVAQELYDCPQELLSSSANNYGYADEPIYASIDEIYSVPQKSVPARRPSAFAY